MAGSSRSPLTRSNCWSGWPHHLTTWGSPSQCRTSGKSSAVMGRNSYMQSMSGALQRLDGDAAVGENTDIGRDIKRPADDGFCIERSMEQGAGGGKCIIPARADAHDTILRLQYITGARSEEHTSEV